MPLTVGIDLGGTKTIVGLVDQSGKLVKSTTIKTRVQSGPEAIVQDIATAFKEVSSGYSVQGTGVGMAGQIVKDTGVVHFAPNLGWRDFPLQSALEKATNLPVAVTNDVRVAAWGEWLYGAGKGATDLACIFVGTGIGSGIVSGGKMLDGATNTAGEVGHMVIDIHGPQCTCGNRGCFEAISGGGGIARRARLMAVTYPSGGKQLIDFAGGKVDNIDSKHVFEAYRQQLPLAILILEEAKAGLIIGVSNVVNVYNPAKVIMGGGIINGNPELIDVIRAGVKKNALKAAQEKLEILPSALQADAGVIGAAAFFNREAI